MHDGNLHLPPLNILRSWSESKYWLLSFFKLILDGISKKDAQVKPDSEGTSLMECFLSLMDPSSLHNYALLMLWALQGNVIPVSIMNLMASF